MSEVDVQFRKASPGAIFFNPMNFGKSSDIALHPSNKSPILSLRPSSSDTFHTVNDWHRSGKGLNKLFSDSSSTLLFLDEVLGDNLEVLRNLFDYLEEWIGNETDNLEVLRPLGLIQRDGPHCSLMKCKRQESIWTPTIFMQNKET
ncbi:hypothetical protein FXO37_32830 [Capsicum annuum]|nr:hypothetical protein FXO37_32830 [Capsicum annuum]